MIFISKIHPVFINFSIGIIDCFCNIKSTTAIYKKQIKV